MQPKREGYYASQKRVPGIRRDQRDGIKTADARKGTLNDLFEINLKRHQIIYHRKHRSLSNGRPVLFAVVASKRRLGTKNLDRFGGRNLEGGGNFEKRIGRESAAVFNASMRFFMQGCSHYHFRFAYAQEETGNERRF